MSKRMKNAAAILLALLIAVLLEVAVFNVKALSSAGRGWRPLPEPELSGDLTAKGEQTLIFRGVDGYVGSCHVVIEVFDEDGEPAATEFTVLLTDEGHSAEYEAGTVDYLPSLDRGTYFRINPYGKVRDIKLIIKANKGSTWVLKTAEINGRIPFRISVPRMLGIFALLMLLWVLRPGSAIHENRWWQRGKRKLLVTALVLILNLGAVFGLSLMNNAFVKIPDHRNWAHHFQYAKLARSLAEGKTNVDGPKDAELMDCLAQLEDPYEFHARREALKKNGVYIWDTAYCNGHLYVYFGVVPVLLTYLPFYLLTGRDLPTILPAILSFWLTVIGAFLLLRAVIRRWFPDTPYSHYLLLSVLLGNCTCVLLNTMEPSFYILPIAFSTAFVFFALALWISAAERWELLQEEGGAAPEEGCFVPCRRPKGFRGIALRICLGGLLAALVAGCRPQFLLWSAFVLPILLGTVRRERKPGRTVCAAVLLAVPYLAVAAGLMYYNAVRFGSPFDFGANYNLTTNDMPLRGWRWGRLADGFFDYLFRLPNADLRFPFLHVSETQPLYMGRTIREGMFGGAMLLHPFLWSLLLLRRARPVLREKKLRCLALLPLVFAVVVIAADTEMAGILWRYSGDFLPLMYLSSILVFLAAYRRTGPAGRRRLTAFLAGAVVVTLLACFLVGVTFGKLFSRTPDAYFHVRELFF